MTEMLFVLLGLGMFGAFTYRIMKINELVEENNAKLSALMTVLGRDVETGNRGSPIWAEFEKVWRAK